MELVSLSPQVITCHSMVIQRVLKTKHVMDVNKPVHRPYIFSSKSVKREREKIYRGGFIDRQRKGEAHADVFQKNEKKNKTSSVYRLDVNGRRTLRSVLAISFQRP